MSIIRDHIERPSSLAFLPDGGLLVASEDAASGGIGRFDKYGKWKGNLLPDGFGGAISMASDGCLFALNTGRNESEVYAIGSDGRPLFRFGGPVSAFGDASLLYLPRDIRATGTQVVVSRFGDGAVNIYDRSGRYIESIKRKQLAVSSKDFVGPTALDVDNDGKIYVCVEGSNTIQVFTPES